MLILNTHTHTFGSMPVLQSSVSEPTFSLCGLWKRLEHDMYVQLMGFFSTQTKASAVVKIYSIKG